MGGIQSAAGVSAGQMATAARNTAIEGAPNEDSKESQAQKIAELQKSAATKAAPPSPQGVGGKIDTTV
jgi:hypothetical protein